MNKDEILLELNIPLDKKFVFAVKNKIIFCEIFYVNFFKSWILNLFLYLSQLKFIIIQLF